MRLFRKAGGNNPAKGRKSKRGTDNEYEYVRKEYGYDFVPPSRYVPSHSMSDDDDDIADEETIEVQWQGAAPVKIIQPRSELSASLPEEDVDYNLSPLGRSRMYGRARDDRKSRH
ncbi:MAG: hypothetical protein SGARI_006633, partial [Bacillariaceae sp.]